MGSGTNNKQPFRGRKVRTLQERPEEDPSPGWTGQRDIFKKKLIFNSIQFSLFV